MVRFEDAASGFAAVAVQFEDSVALAAEGGEGHGAVVLMAGIEAPSPSIARSQPAGS